MAIVTLYKVLWRTNGRNSANIQQQTSYVVAAANAQASTIGAAIQAQNGDGAAVSVDHVYTERVGVIQ